MEIQNVELLDIAKFENKVIKINGWLHGKRGSGKVQFLMLRNSGRIIQVVAEKTHLGEEKFTLLKNLGQETSLSIFGKLIRSEKSELGFEIQLDDFEIFGQSKDYPITPKDHGPDFLHNHRHLWLRSKRQLSILKIRDELSFSIRKFFHENHYTLIDTPILTGSVGESAGTLFSTDYFDLGSAYLAQTGQLYLETSIFAHNRVYCFGPTFRAEKSKTRRHLTEFWMLEAETAFLDNEKNIQFQENFIKAIIKEIIQNSIMDLEILERDLDALSNFIYKDFPKVEYTEAIEILKSKNESIEWGEDINAERENILTSHYSSAIFIKNYPKSIKAFYMKENPANPKTVLCADLIAPEGVGEIIGGSEREEDYNKIVERLKSEGLQIDTYNWYLDLRKYGSVPHSGFGLGLERLVAWICGLPHVRECIPYPRLMGRLDP
ncbi:MAG: asparagine--tRNA ligase [Leptospiraceae bacterium]|nr:asparagine--tRNA ligase [Leptospiraceae bacterium]MCK6382310.1 asparagine--tRNA ligase [Leptospiraceae bacterium]NUM42296.1 asparagine--tRNA ligase [Leptospiraceae bacterium]